MLTEQTPGRLLLTALTALTTLLFGLALSKAAEIADGKAASGATPAFRATASLSTVAQPKKPRAKARFALSRRHLTIGQAVRLHGRARPGGHRRFKVVVHGPRSAVFRTTTGKRGRYQKRWRPKQPGIYRLRAYVGRNDRARGGAGPRRTVTVYRPAHASWYGPGLYGNRTACGQTLTSGTLGVAHKTLPCGTKLRLRNGRRHVTVRVIDRGPFIPGREFDLTYATKERLGFGDIGTVYSSR